MAKLKIFFPDGSEITHDLPEETTSVGRIAENQLHIPDDSASSRHAEILFENANFYVRDLDSTNGTFINGSKTESAVLKHGDEVRFGSVACLFISENADSAVAPEAAAIEEQQPSSKSVRPENFTSCSPTPRNKNSKDFSPLIVASAALIGIAATAAALYFIFQPPV
jgi:pSer/pThr/pTyr-binding forkhead associated (FHA) protein